MWRIAKSEWQRERQRVEKEERKDVDAGGRWGHSPHLLRDVGHAAPAYELKGRTSLLLRGRCYHLNFVNSRLSIHFTVDMMMLPGFSWRIYVNALGLVELNLKIGNPYVTWTWYACHGVITLRL
jgi:hypothetical protein